MSFYFIKLDYYYFLEAFYTKLIFTAFKKTYYIISIKIIFFNKVCFEAITPSKLKIVFIYIYQQISEQQQQ